MAQPVYEVDPHPSGCFLFQLFLLSAALPAIAANSWWVFGGGFLVMIVVLMVPILRKIAGILLTLAWGVVGFSIGGGVAAIGGGAPVVIGLLFLFFGWVFNYVAVAEEFEERP